MLFSLFIISMLVAGISATWKSFLNDFPNIRGWIRINLPSIRKLLFCGYCLTGWTAFFTTLIIDPLPRWTPRIRFASPTWFIEFVHFAAGWMAVMMIAFLIRGAVIASEELLHYIVHTLNDRPGDLH